MSSDDSETSVITNTTDGAATMTEPPAQLTPFSQPGIQGQDTVTPFYAYSDPSGLTSVPNSATYADFSWTAASKDVRPHKDRKYHVLIENPSTNGVRIFISFQSDYGQTKKNAINVPIDSGEILGLDFISGGLLQFVQAYYNGGVFSIKFAVWADDST